MPGITSCRPSLAALLGLSLLCVAGIAAGRELAVDIDEMVEVEIATIGLAAGSGAPVVLLREPDARDVIPIFIGPTEAEAILRGLRDIRPRRPLTHELLGNVLVDSGIRLERVFVDDLVDNTFLGMLELHLPGQDDPVLVDSRPSDALALALRAGATIHVAPKVLEAARQIDFEGLDHGQIVNAVGITVTEATDDLREALDLPDHPGVLVSGVTGPAREAGMEPGSLIVEVNDRTPESPMDFLEAVRATPEGETARIRYWQAGAFHELELSTDIPSPRQRPGRQEEGIAL